MDETLPAPKRSGAVTAAAVIAILGSVLVLLFAGLGLLGIATMQRIPNQPDLTPQEVRNAGFVGALLIVALGAWGLTSGIGLLGYRNWARTSTLAWSGLTIIFGVIALVSISMMQFPVAPNSPPGVEGFVRGFAVSVFAVPVAVAAWWLILFTRKPIVALFRSSPASVVGSPLDASGFPAVAPKPLVPLPITVIAWFIIVSGAFSVLFFSLNQSPVLLFGRILRAPASTAFMLLSCAICIGCGIGLLKLRPWSFWLLIAYQVFGLINGTASLLSPNQATLIKEIRARHDSTLPGSFFQSITILVLVFLTVPLVILLYYRSSFSPPSSSTPGS
jgi:hypothetical protein